MGKVICVIFWVRSDEILLHLRVRDRVKTLRFCYVKVMPLSLTCSTPICFDFNIKVLNKVSYPSITVAKKNINYCI